MKNIEEFLRWLFVEGYFVKDKDGEELGIGELLAEYEMRYE